MEFLRSDIMPEACQTSQCKEKGINMRSKPYMRDDKPPTGELEQDYNGEPWIVVLIVIVFFVGLALMALTADVGPSDGHQRDNERRSTGAP
jgi:hypothetical protein